MPPAAEADHGTEEILASIYSAYLRGQDTDCCIVVKGQEYHYHKIVEAADSRVILDEEDPLQISKFMQFLYTGSYAPPNGLCSAHGLPGELCGAHRDCAAMLEDLHFHIAIFDLGDRRCIPSLMDLASACFQQLLNAHAWSEGDREMIFHSDIIDSVFKLPAINRSLQTALCEFIEQDEEALLADDELRKIINDTPGLGLGLLDAKFYADAVRRRARSSERQGYGAEGSMGGFMGVGGIVHGGIGLGGVGLGGIGHGGMPHWHGA